jgi:putative porin
VRRFALLSLAPLVCAIDMSAQAADWVESVRLYGDMRARIEATTFGDDNALGVYRDFNVVNDRGGIARAGDTALLNTSEDRFRLAGRLRLGLLAQLGNSFKLDARLASGNARSPVSTNQTLGNYDGRWTVNIDKAALLWNPISAEADRELDVRFGRFSNPFVTNTELVWDNDVTFEGLSATYALDLFGRDPARMERGLFVTLGAFPLQEVEQSGDDKWLYGAQLGGELPLGTQSRLRLSASYFDYEKIAGVRNSPNSQEFDFTAPHFVQKGNTLFDIRNDADPSTNLFALAGDYKLLSANVALDLAFDAAHVVLGGEYISNVGWDAKQVQARTGLAVDARTSGYEAILTVGRPVLAAVGQWRAFLSYRYLQRDATLDGFTDSELHLGGTDLQGYLVGVDVGLSKGTWLRLRYQTATEIDGPPLGIDVWQLDLNGQF